MVQGYDITEYEAAWRLTEFRIMGKHFQGLAYENISATGKNTGMHMCSYMRLKTSNCWASQHYPTIPRIKRTKVRIKHETPYLKCVSWSLQQDLTLTCHDM